MGLVIRAVAVNAAADTLSSLERSSRAAASVIARTGIRAEDVAVLINTGVYRDFNLVEPAMAAVIQKKAGIGLEYTPGGSGTFSFDLMNGGCGVLNAVQAAQALLPEGGGGHAVIVSGDTHPALDPGLLDDFPFASVGAAVLLGHEAGDVGFGALHAASDTGPVAPEGYLGLRSMGQSGRMSILIERPSSLLDQLLPHAVAAARAVIDSERLCLPRTLLISSRPTLDFGKELAAAIGLPRYAAITAQWDKDPHTSAIPLAYRQASVANLFVGVDHILFVAAGGGPTAAAIAYRVPAHDRQAAS